MKKVLLIVSLLMLSLLVSACTSQVPAQQGGSTPVAVETVTDAAQSASQTARDNVYTVVLTESTFQPADVEIKAGETVEWVNQEADSTFQPADVEIKAGETVEWVNKDAYDHTVSFNTLGVDEFLPAGGSFTHTFAEAGEYTYHCSIHSRMQGKVIVN